MQQQEVRIPIFSKGQRDQEILIIQPHEVSEEIISILKNERVDFQIWFDCARALLSQGHIDSYKRLLNTLSGEIRGLPNPTDRERFIRVQSICCLGDLAQQQARLSTNPEEKRRLITEANSCYFDAVRVDNKEMLPHIGLGQCALLNNVRCFRFTSAFFYPFLPSSPSPFPLIFSQPSKYEQIHAERCLVGKKRVYSGNDIQMQRQPFQRRHPLPRPPPLCRKRIPHGPETLPRRTQTQPHHLPPRSPTRHRHLSTSSW